MGLIDTLRIELSESDDEDPGIRFLVNGTDLLDQVRETEEPFAIREGQPSNAGDYRGLPGATFAERRTEFMGESSGWPVDSSTCSTSTRRASTRVAGPFSLGFPLIERQSPGTGPNSRTGTEATLREPGTMGHSAPLSSTEPRTRPSSIGRSTP